MMALSRIRVLNKPDRVLRRMGALCYIRFSSSCLGFVDPGSGGVEIPGKRNLPGRSNVLKDSRPRAIGRDLSIPAAPATDAVSVDLAG